MSTTSSGYRYALLMVDNFHIGDPDEGDEYEVGPFPSCEAALDHARGIVDSVAQAHAAGQTAEELYRGWAHYGETPILVTDDPNCHFRATEYARQRIEDICRPDDRKN